MVKTAEGIDIPGGGDFYDYTAEQRAMAASQRTVVPVANRAAAEVVAAAMATDGRPVSNTNPLVVFRLDNERVEVKNATGWGGPPQGIVAYAEMTSASGAIAAKAIVLNIPTYTFKAGRTYRLRIEGNYYQTATGSTFVYGIASCPVGDPAAQTTGLTGLASQADNANAASEGRRFDVAFLYRPAADGALQMKFTAERVTGSATTIISGAADNPVQFYIEDMGVTQGSV